MTNFQYRTVREYSSAVDKRKPTGKSRYFPFGVQATLPLHSLQKHGRSKNVIWGSLGGSFPSLMPTKAMAARTASTFKSGLYVRLIACFFAAFSLMFQMNVHPSLCGPKHIEFFSFIGPRDFLACLLSVSCHLMNELSISLSLSLFPSCSPSIHGCF